MTQATVFNVYRTADAPKTADEIAARNKELFDARLSSHSGAVRPSYAVAGMVWHNSTLDRWFMYNGTTDVIVPYLTAAAPGSAAAAGVPGDYFVDAGFKYDCISTDTWVRNVVATW